MPKILESGFESVVLTLLGQMGFACHGGEAFDPDASGERESYHGAMLPGRLKAAVARINPDLPAEAVAAAANAVLDLRFTDLVQENQRIHRLRWGNPGGPAESGGLGNAGARLAPPGCAARPAAVFHGV